MADWNAVTQRVATGAALSAPADADEIIAAGFNVVIDCRAEFDDGPLFSSIPGVIYVWAPTLDDGLPKSADYFAHPFTVAMAALGQPNRKVYAHCAAGVNRGPSMAYGILVCLGFGTDLAEQMVRRARPQVGLAYKNDAAAAARTLGYI